MTRSTRRIALAAWVMFALGGGAAQATWSIIIIDRETREIAIGSATCLVNFDLRRWLPVVLVDVGAAAAQSSVDNLARNRQRIREQLLLGTAPEQILAVLAANDPAHQTRQYGIADTLGRATTFTGSLANDWAGGITGEVGNLVYAIQGNILTGEEVVLDAEAAVLNPANVGLPQKLMAAMEAARCRGGDGRCSCLTGAPDSCEFPPESCEQNPPPFPSTSQAGFMIVTRRGDVDGTTCSTLGCARGTYYLNFNPINGVAGVDPVVQMRSSFDTFRAGLVGVTDQVVSTVAFPSVLPPGAGYQAPMQIRLLDWQGQPISGSPTVTVATDPRDGSGKLTRGKATPIGGGVYELPISSSDTPGTDRLAVRVVLGAYDRLLLPAKPVRVLARGDLNADGSVSVSDIGPFALALTDPKSYAAAFPEVVASIVGDFDGNATLTVSDISGFVGAIAGAP